LSNKLSLESRVSLEGRSRKWGICLQIFKVSFEKEWA